MSPTTNKFLDTLETKGPNSSLLVPHTSGMTWFCFHGTNQEV